MAVARSVVCGSISCGEIICSKARSCDESPGIVSFSAYTRSVHRSTDLSSCTRHDFLLLHHHPNLHGLKGPKIEGDKTIEMERKFEEKTDVLSFPLYQSLPIDKSDEIYRENVTDWAPVLDQYQQGLEWTASQGTRHYEERHRERGLLLGIFSKK